MGKLQSNLLAISKNGKVNLASHFNKIIPNKFQNSKLLIRILKNWYKCSEREDFVEICFQESTCASCGAYTTQRFCVIRFEKYSFILEPGPQGTRSSEAVERREESGFAQGSTHPDQHFWCASACLPNFFRGKYSGGAVKRPGN